MRQRKKWQDLTIVDDYMFKLVMEHKRICKHLIERVLKIQIRDIVYLEKEKTVKNNYQSKGIRLDVYVEDEVNSRFILEMQITDYGQKELARRSRYYQSTIDYDFLQTGKKYKELGDSYVIFFCPFQVFDGERCLYTYRNICQENNRLRLDDGTAKVFLSSHGQITEDLHEDIVAFLAYMNGKLTNNSFVREMDDTIIELKENKEKEADYMTYSMIIDEEREEAWTESSESSARKFLHRMLKWQQPINQQLLADIAEDTSLPEERVKELARQEGLI